MVLYHANVNVNLIVNNVTQIKTGIAINFGVSPKIKKANFIRAKKIILEMLAHLLVKIVNIYKMLLMIQELCLEKL